MIMSAAVYFSKLKFIFFFFKNASQTIFLPTKPKHRSYAAELRNIVHVRICTVFQSFVLYT